MELLRDNFEMGTSNWTMTPSGVWSTSMDGSTVLGSMGATGSSAMRAASAGELSWTDVQIEARVKVTSFAGSSSGYYAGVCARYQSTSAYACFALRSNGQIMFRVGSNNTAAATPPGGSITEGTWYSVRVVARGASITAFLNGTEIASGSRVTSGAPASGRIALATPGTNAVFDDIVVTTP
jgi:pectate lyase